MSEPMTEVQFAQQVGYLTKTCAAWSADMLGPKEPGELDKPVTVETVARFAQEIRSRLDRIEAWSGAGKTPPVEGVEDRLYHHALSATTPDERFRHELSHRQLGRWRVSEMRPSAWLWDLAAIARLSSDEARDLYRRILAPTP